MGAATRLPALTTKVDRPLKLAKPAFWTPALRNRANIEQFTDKHRRPEMLSNDPT